MQLKAIRIWDKSYLSCWYGVSQKMIEAQAKFGLTGWQSKGESVLFAHVTQYVARITT